MTRRSILAIGGASLALVAAPAVASAAKVSVRIEGGKKTLQTTESVTTPSGSIRKFGAPAGACPGSSAQGALQAATHGGWKGTFSKTYGEYFVTSVLGETPNAKTAYWGIWVNNKYATTGACQIKLHSGDDVLFAVDSAKKHEHPLGIIARSRQTAGSTMMVKVVSYSDSGKAKPVVGARVRDQDGTVWITGKGGHLPESGVSPQKETFTASAKGYIRSAPKTVTFVNR